MALATTAYAVLHSALASRQAKQLATRMLGERRRNGLYRGFYNVQATITFMALGAYSRRLPNATLYEVDGGARLLLRLAQVSALLYGVHATRQVGTLRMLGITSLQSFRRGDAHVVPEPESQGPTLGEDGRMRVTGAFRFSRHPLNLSPLLVFGLNPTMTSRLMGFTAVSAIYLVVGSLHEEYRLRKAYGEPYVEYTNSGVPFYLPGIAGSQTSAHAGAVDVALHGRDVTESAA